MTPEIDFKYSYVYDGIFRNSIELINILKKINKKYPSSIEIINFMNELKRVWYKEGSEILERISSVSGLKWSREKITCYIVGFCKPMSDPLTIKACRDITHGVDILTHELIHSLQSEVSDKKWSRWIKYLDSKYPNDSRTTKDHIFLNAVHMAIYLEFFGADRFERDLDNSREFYDYKRAWNIVQNEGHYEIINKFRKIIEN